MKRKKFFPFVLLTFFLFALFGCNSAQEEQKRRNFRFIKLSREGKLNQVKKLLEEGANVNFQNPGGYTALMYASFKGNIKVVNFLLSHQANVNLVNENKYTALMFATIEGKEEVVSRLIAFGAALNLKNDDGQTALMLAAYEDRPNIVDALLFAGADIHLKNNEGQTLLDIAFLRRDRMMVRLFRNLGLNSKNLAYGERSEDLYN